MWKSLIVVVLIKSLNVMRLTCHNSALFVDRVKMTCKYCKPNLARDVSDPTVHSQEKIIIIYVSNQ